MRIIYKFNLVTYTHFIFLMLGDEVPKLVTFEEVLKFFVNKWVPIVNSASAGNAIEEFMWNVHDLIKELPKNEVRWISEN